MASKSHARKIEIREPIQADLGCPALSRKIFYFCFSEIGGSLRHPASARGVTADRHET
jgi:hypothetical protein